MVLLAAQEAPTVGRSDFIAACRGGAYRQVGWRIWEGSTLWFWPCCMSATLVSIPTSMWCKTMFQLIEKQYIFQIFGDEPKNVVITFWPDDYYRRIYPLGIIIVGITILLSNKIPPIRPHCKIVKTAPLVILSVLHLIFVYNFELEGYLTLEKKKCWSHWHIGFLLCCYYSWIYCSWVGKSTKHLGKSPNLVLCINERVCHILNPNKDSMGVHDLNLNGCCCMLPGAFACQDVGYCLSTAAD